MPTVSTPVNPEQRLARATRLLLEGRYLEGWAEFEARFDTDRYRFEIPGPRWDGGDLDSRTILLLHEQGYGDAIMMARYIPLLAVRGARVIMDCPSALVPLLLNTPGLTGMIPDPDFRNDTKDGYKKTLRLPEFDVWAPMMSLPFLFGTTLETIPSDVRYLQAEPVQASRLRRLITDEGRLNVGIAWAGNPNHVNDKARSIPLRAFGPLAKVPGVQLVSLQVGKGSEQANHVDFPLTAIGGQLKDFGQTAALVEAMDLVITCDSAVAHLAGALGKPVWVVLPATPEWRWPADHPGSRWYPTARTFRQRPAGYWSLVFHDLASALFEFAAA